jgi:hypothetical protein
MEFLVCIALNLKYKRFLQCHFEKVGPKINWTSLKPFLPENPGTVGEDPNHGLVWVRIGNFFGWSLKPVP